MGVNKVVFGAVSIMDISDSTVTPETLMPGITAYNAAGEKIVGTFGTDKCAGGEITRTSASLIEINTGLDDIKALIVYAEAPDENTSCTCGFVYTKSNSKIIYHTKKSSFVPASYSANDGSNYITVENGSFSGNRYGNDSSYSFMVGLTYKWIAFGTGSGGDASDRYFCENGSMTVPSDSDSTDIETGLDDVKCFIAFNNTSSKNNTIDSIIYCDFVQMQSAKGTASNSASIGEFFVVDDTGEITISKGQNSSGASYAFATDSPYEWVAWGTGGTGNNGSQPEINLQSKTVTPSASQQIIKPDSGYDGLGQVTVAGDSDLIASNIKNGVNIFGVAGNYTGATSGGGSGNCEAYIINPTNPAVDFDRADRDIKVWGYGYYESSGGWMNRTTVYAFAGDKYYTSSTYGDPTETSLNVSVSNGQLTGLPELTGGSLLVTKGV